ncbi:MAG: SlyX family protein [Myxococcales bacterium]|nr:SlyX family protein [Myxococcales bacterium]MCB9568924.1 SlyX family protein [Myxococcales bacterium]MCB9704936.1 SlyX family protein [Myxococcales bacterium]
MPDDPSADRVRALEERLVDLEVRFAFQQQTLEDLDVVVREFAGRVEALERDLAELRALAPAAAPPLGEPSSDDFSAL